MSLKYTVEEQLLKISNLKSGYEIQLNRIEWGDNPAKLDIRKWVDDEPKKGFTLEESELREIYDYLRGYFEPAIEPAGNMASDSISSEPELIDYRQFIVKSDMSDCKAAGHSYKKVIAVAPVYFKAENKVVLQDAFDTYYCKDCKAYYMGKNGYAILNKAGHIMCSVFEKKDFDEFMDNGWRFPEHDFQLAQESKLMHLGYNVSEKSGLSDNERHTILKYSYLSGIMTKEEIISHLSFLIKLNEAKHSMEYAVDKWNRDRKWIKNVPKSKEIPVGIKRIILRKD